MPLLPGDKAIFTDPHKLEVLGENLSDLIDDLERDHRARIDDHAVHEDWYEALPKSPKKTFPFEGASNIVAPLIGTHSDALISRLFGTTHRYEKLLHLEAYNEAASDSRADVETWLNLAGRTEYDTTYSTFSAYKNFVIHNYGFIDINYRVERDWLLLPGRFNDGAGTGATSRARPRPVRTVVRRGPLWESVHPSQLLWDPWDGPIEDAETIVRQFDFSWSQLKAMAQSGDWLEDAVDEIKSERGSNSPASEARRRQRKRRGFSGDESKEPYDIREVRIRWPILESFGIGASDLQPVDRHESDVKTPDVELVVTLHRNSKRVLRVTPKPYLHTGWNIVGFNIPDGRGVAKKLEQLQRLVSTSLNQGVDVITLANSMKFKTTDSSLKSARFKVNEPVYLRSDIDDLQPLELGKQIQPDIAIINVAHAMAERLGSPDPLFGREQRSGGHPSPATNFLGQLEESAKMMFPAMHFAAKAISRAGSLTASLYQQFDTDPDGRLTRILGAEDAKNVQSWMFPTQDNAETAFFYEVKSLTSRTNPDNEARKAVVISQMTGNYFATLLKIVPILESPQTGPLTKKTIFESINALTESQRHFLEASEVDEVKDFLAEFNEDRGAKNGELLERVAAVAGEAATGGGGVPNGGVGRSNGGSPVGAPTGPGPAFQP